MTSVAERLEPPELFDYFVQQRRRWTHHRAPGCIVGSSIIGTLRNGGLVGLLSDRDIVGNGIEVEFFGETTTMPPARPPCPAHRCGAGDRRRLQWPRRDHRAVVQAPLDTERRGTLRQDVARLTQEIAIRLEGLIREAPSSGTCSAPVVGRPPRGPGGMTKFDEHHLAGRTACRG